jgi:hypothetical protein
MVLKVTTRTAKRQKSDVFRRFLIAECQCERVGERLPAGLGGDVAGRGGFLGRRAALRSARNDGRLGCFVALRTSRNDEKGNVIARPKAVATQYVGSHGTLASAWHFSGLLRPATSLRSSRFLAMKSLALLQTPFVVSLSNHERA